jgi:uncharacterized membrane protein YphA (DoxX/SURF4 family)
MNVAFALEWWSMQRLFGTFPNGRAGFGLLILRVVVAVALISHWRLCPEPESELLLALSRIAAVLILVGWYTPLAALSATLISVGSFWVCREFEVNALVMAILVAVGLLGAGAYSVDARLYGRRRLVVGRRQGKWEGSRTP